MKKLFLLLTLQFIFIIFGHCQWVATVKNLNKETLLKRLFKAKEIVKDTTNNHGVIGLWKPDTMDTIKGIFSNPDGILDDTTLNSTWIDTILYFKTAVDSMALVIFETERRGDGHFHIHFNYGGKALIKQIKDENNEVDWVIVLFDKFSYLIDDCSKDKNSIVYLSPNRPYFLHETNTYDCSGGCGDKGWSSFYDFSDYTEGSNFMPSDFKEIFKFTNISESCYDNDKIETTSFKLIKQINENDMYDIQLIIKQFNGTITKRLYRYDINNYLYKPLSSPLHKKLKYRK